MSGFVKNLVQSSTGEDLHVVMANKSTQDRYVRDNFSKIRLLAEMKEIRSLAQHSRTEIPGAETNSPRSDLIAPLSSDPLTGDVSEDARSAHARMLNGLATIRPDDRTKRIQAIMDAETRPTGDPN